jgi:hypothetical protein
MIGQQPAKATRIESRAAGRGGQYAPLLLAFALSMLAALPLLIGPGIINTRAGGDSPFLIQRVQAVMVNLEAGTLPARWMPDAAHGLGYPALNFYAALPYYVAALLARAGLGILWGIKITQALGFVLAGVMTYRLARAMGAGPWGALPASAFYTFAPFHMVNVYVRGDALSEFYAMALYPVVIWAVLRLVRRPSAASIALLAGSYALLVLSHNISALIFSPLVGLWLLAEALWGRRKDERPTWRIPAAGVGALALGLLLSAWFWAPALREQSLVQLGDQTTGYFHFAGHFRTTDLIQRTLIHDYAIEAERDPFNMGLVQALLAGMGLVALAVRVVRRHPVGPSAAMAALTLLGSTWLITPWSRPVWEHLPLLPYVQFPWRFLAPQAFAAALVMTNLDGIGGRREYLKAVAVAPALLVTVVGMAGLRIDRLPITEADITPERLMLYETYSGNIGSTVRYEYLPRDMVPRPHLSAVQLAGERPAPLALEGRLDHAALLHQTPHRQEWDLVVAEPTLLAFHTTFYPGWEASVDGRAQGVEPLAGSGLVGLRLSSGAHRVVFTFNPTPVRRYAEWAAAAGLAVLFALIALALRQRPRTAPPRRSEIVALAAGALVIVWPVVAPMALRPGTAAASAKDGPLVMDFARAPYLHPQPDGVLFGDSLLLDYELDPTEVSPGEVLTLSTRWASPDAATVSVQLRAATAHLYHPSPTWAGASAPLKEETELALRLPDDLPPGLYVLRLEVLRDGHAEPIHTIDGVGMHELALEPLKVVAERPATGEEEILGSFGPEQRPSAVSLVDAQVETEGGEAEVRLTWRSESQAPLNYMLSVRLRRADGEMVAGRDLPPLLGVYPTMLWQPGNLYTDRVLLPLPEGTTIGSDHLLEVVLYDRLTLQAVGTVEVPLP